MQKYVENRVGLKIRQASLIAKMASKSKTLQTKHMELADSQFYPSAEDKEEQEVSRQCSKYNKLLKYMKCCDEELSLPRATIHKLALKYGVPAGVHRISRPVLSTIDEEIFKSTEAIMFEAAMLTTASKLKTIQENAIIKSITINNNGSAPIGLATEVARRKLMK